MPPSCSFVSANGPSVTVTLPLRQRSVAALLLLWSASILAAGPAIGYAQGASEQLASRETAWDQHADVSAYEPVKADVRDDLQLQAK